MPIKWKATADRARLTPAELNALLEGRVGANVANRLGATIADVQAFIAGTESAHMADRLGLPNMASAMELGQELGREGAIGLLIGLLFDERS